MNNREFREAILNSVRQSILEKGLKEYIKVPHTALRKRKFFAHVELTSTGKKKFKTVVANPATQIIHKDFINLIISNEPCLAMFTSKIEEYKLYARQRLDEFLYSIN